MIHAGVTVLDSVEARVIGAFRTARHLACLANEARIQAGEAWHYLGRTPADAGALPAAVAAEAEAARMADAAREALSDAVRLVVVLGGAQYRTTPDPEVDD